MKIPLPPRTGNAPPRTGGAPRSRGARRGHDNEKSGGIEDDDPLAIAGFQQDEDQVLALDLERDASQDKGQEHSDGDGDGDLGARTSRENLPLSQQLKAARATAESGPAASAPKKLRDGFGLDQVRLSDVAKSAQATLNPEAEPLQSPSYQPPKAPGKDPIAALNNSL